MRNVLWSDDRWESRASADGDCASLRQDERGCNSAWDAGSRHHDLNSFSRGTREEVSEAIADSKKKVAALEPILASIRQRRNSWLAHLDPRTVADPKALAARAKLTIPDLDRAFEETEEMLIRLSCAYDGTFGELKFIGGDDYETALDWIRRAKCASIEKYEKEFGAGSWTGPRPKDCSRAEYDLL